ncbi:hypothetical protein BHYA_0272g00120 [Botrytis hyacinthi]|uniref:Uncharacterized protein n=1 Tax=Botrytis hyacinthi TaxID=278943 RepID=A0A4Z1GC47_9HELO|nr:hypothetical protein BHYA_0272g00120 [Botrytis hyacinthi]
MTIDLQIHSLKKPLRTINQAPPRLEERPQWQDLWLTVSTRDNDMKRTVNEAYNGWSRSRRLQPPSPRPSPRPTSYNFLSHQFLQEPVIPFDRRPAYYPDHYDGKSYNPYEASGTERADDNIVQQLLLEWTPAGEEAEAAAAQNTDENNHSNANRFLNDMYNTSSEFKSQRLHTAQEQVERTGRPDATKMNVKGGRRPMTTVENDAGEFSDFENLSFVPRRAMTNFF